MPEHEASLLAGANVEFFTIFAKLAEINFKTAQLFDDLVHHGLGQIAQFPHSAPLFVDRYRRLRLGRLPFALFYAIDAKRVFVHAILDIRLPRYAILRRLGLLR